MAKTFLGQNFLIDEAWQKKIVSYFNPSGPFMEIGPGRGAITNQLLKRFQDFYVYEMDSDLAKIHRQNSRLKIIEGNFLDWNFSIDGAPVQNFSLIGNLPYESGSAMLLKIAERASQVSDFLFLLQKEVVERISAKPKTSDFASFTVLIQGQFDIEPLDIIPPECFRPSPKVFSQLIRGRRRSYGAHPTDSEFLKFLKRSFLQKRKTARNAWKSLMDPHRMNRVFEKFQLSPMTRAEEIEVDLWPKIYEEVKK